MRTSQLGISQSTRQVSFVFHLDDIAQEPDETVRLQLEVSQAVIDIFGFDNTAFLLDTVNLVIVDNNRKCSCHDIINVMCNRVTEGVT